MATTPTKIIIIKSDGSTSVHPNSKIDPTSPAKAIINDIKDAAEIAEDCDLYIKVNPDIKLSTLTIKPDSIIIISAKLKSKAAELG